MTKICQEPYRKWIIDSSHAHEWEGLTIWENNGGDTHIVAHVVADHASQCDCEANARLIAAAPDLLSALEAGVTAIGEAMIDDDLDSEDFRDLIAEWLNDATATIKAAKGESDA